MLTAATVRTRPWLTIIISVACALATRALHAREGAAPVTCRVRDDPRGREFTLRPAGAQTSTAATSAQWQLSMRDTESKSVSIDLLLPGAKPVIGETSARLSYQNANGGRHVDLEVSPTGSRLDVWVDYGLEVNVEPDLDPRVDRLNTDGPLTAIDCAIQQGAK